MFKPADPVSNLLAFVKVRASLEVHDVVFWMRGNIYHYAPGEPARLLLACEGFNIGRAEQIDDNAFRWLSREVTVYRDAETGAILEHWKNPITGQANEVQHAWLDPVNAMFTTNGPADSHVPTGFASGGSVHFVSDSFALHPNPLPPAEYRREVSSELFQAADCVRFIASRRDVDDDSVSAQSLSSAVSMSPYLPWMLMGERAGFLLAHSGGHKVMDGYDGLPKDMRAYVERTRPEFAFAPRTFVTPNESQWTLYQKERGPA